MSEVSEVKAETIDPPELMSGADRWLAETRTKVAEKAGQYTPMQVDSPDRRMEAKRLRAAVNRDIKAIETDKRSMTKRVKERVRAFDEGCRGVLAPLSDAEKAYQQAIDDYEAQVIRDRMARLESEWRDTYPDLDGLVDWGTFAGAHQDDDPTCRWGLFGTNSEKARLSMVRAADATMTDIQTIRAAAHDDSEARETVADYARTLDLSQALRDAAGRRERLARVKSAEDESRRWEEDKLYVQEAFDVPSALVDAREAAQPEPEYETPVPVTAESESVSPRFSVFRVTVPMGSESQFIVAMKAIPGVHGHKVGVE